MNAQVIQGVKVFRDANGKLSVQIPRGMSSSDYAKWRKANRKLIQQV